MLNRVKSLHSADKAGFPGKKFLVIFLIMTAYIFPQSWNSTVTTSVYEPNVVNVDLFTNRDGNHIVIQNSDASNSIKYYLINSSGTLVRSATIETSSGAQFPNISGDNDKVYIVYKLGSNLKFRKSTSAGSSWTDAVSQDVGNNTCNGVDIVYDPIGLHVVYAMQDNGSDYETYYRLIASDSWGSREDVTGYGTEVGGFPSVAVSDNRVHVSYNTGNNPDPLNNEGLAKERDKYYSTWQTPQTVTGQGETSSREKVQVRTDYLYDFYYDFWCELGQCSFEIKVRNRPLNQTSWTSYTSIYTHTNPVQFMGAEQTSNGNLHIIVGDWDLYHKYYNGSSWSSEEELSYLTDGDVNTPLTAVSNDVFAVWKESNSSYIKYAQWDDDPLAPQGLAVQPYQQGNNRYARLTWQLNYEPDVYIKQNNAYDIERRINFLGNWGAWLVVATKSGNVSEFIDYETVGVGDAEVYIAEYRMKARDYNNNLSGYSSSVSIEFQRFVPTAPGSRGGWANKSTESSGNNISYDYNLAQNYPNPFNPTTTINYSIKSTGLVTVKVYDMLGTEVASLVNENMEAGIYSVEFNASSLPSGIYVYRLTASNFVDTKKLLLLK